MEETKGMSIRRQLVDLSMSIVMVAILLSTGVTLALTLREEYRHMEESLTDLSMLLSRTPVVRSALESAEGGEDLDGFLQEMEEDVASVDLVVVADANGRVCYAPDESLVGLSFSQEAVDALQNGEEICLRPANLALDTQQGVCAAVRDKEGRLIGMVFSGIYRRSVTRLVLGTVAQFVGED